MIYDSMIGRAPGSDIDPLVTKAGEVIHIGGEPHPEQAGISDLDIERVVELYPPGSEHSHSKREELDSVPWGIAFDTWRAARKATCQTLVVRTGGVRCEFDGVPTLACF